MKLSLLLPLATLVLWTASAQTSIPIFNPVFQDDTLECNPGSNCGYSGITGWIIGPGTNISKFSTSQYPGAPAEGVFVAAIGNSSVTGSILQTLGATVQANTTYTLRLSIGARSDYSFTGYLASLMAGNVTVASNHSATPVGGSFITDTIVYNSGATPAQLGQPLQIIVKSVGTGQVNVGGASLTYAPE